MTALSADQLISQCNKLRAERQPLERLWDEIAKFTRPSRRALAQASPNAGFRSEPPVRLVDSTAILAVENFASGIYGMMTNPATRWFALRLHDEALNDYGPARDWLYQVEERLFYSFGPQVSRFYAVLPSLYADLACFGTAVFYSEEVPGAFRINDTVRPLSECLIAENAYGEVDTVYRQFHLPAASALKQFGDALSAPARRLAEKSPQAPIKLLHVVAPNPAHERDSLQPEAQPFISIYLEEETRHVLSQNFYMELPFHVPRWTQAPGEVYGRSLGEQVLPDVRMLNRMDETAIRTAQKMMNPPLATTERGAAIRAHIFPGGITYGALDPAGQPVIRPLYTVGEIGVTLEMMEQRRDSIRNAFAFSLMQSSAPPNMTATEWLGREESRLRLLGPNLGRIQSEFLSPLIKRRLAMLWRAQRLPAPPVELASAALEIDYVSPLARAQMAGESQAVVRLYEGLEKIARFAPEVAGIINHAEAVDVLARGWAVPAKLMG